MNNAIIPFQETLQIATAMVKSKYFQDIASEDQATVKILAGREMGLQPFAAMVGIHIIQGRPALGANLIASLIKNDPRYNYKVVELTEKVCSIDFYEQGEKAGNSTFTAEDAKKAGTKNMEKYPKNMLFARAISNGAKWYAAGIFGGSPVYTPEELGADTDEEGNIIETSFVETTQTSAPAASNGNGTHARMSLEMASSELSSDGRPYGELSNAELANRSIGVGKGLQKNGLTPEEKAEYLRKRDAIATLLQHRQQAENDFADAQEVPA